MATTNDADAWLTRRVDNIRTARDPVSLSWRHAYFDGFLEALRKAGLIADADAWSKRADQAAAERGAALSRPVAQSAEASPCR